MARYVVSVLVAVMVFATFQRQAEACYGKRTLCDPGADSGSSCSSVGYGGYCYGRGNGRKTCVPYMCMGMMGLPAITNGNWRLTEIPVDADNSLYCATAQCDPGCHVTDGPMTLSCGFDGWPSTPVTCSPGLATLLALYAVFVCASATSPEPSTCGTNCVDKLCTDGQKCDKGCKDDFFGPSCTESCPLKCATCEQPFSYHRGCLSCKAGFYGKSCELTCTDKCLNSKCDKDNGSCSDGCVTNFTGDMCCTKDGPCIKCLHITHCKTCKGNFTGKNCDYCLDGTHGSNCDKTCNANCKNNVCNRDNGSCIEGCNGNFARYECKNCKRGFWSQDCTKVCHINCDNRKCDRNRGSCKSCKSGSYGHSCNEQCSLNCKVGTCDIKTGKCDQGCKDGFTGDMCDRCVTGKFGTNCDKSCPGNCKGGVCYRADGHCTHGCTENYAGDTCDMCVDGKHGETCSETCPPNCKNSTCEKETGICIGGCNPNFTGDKCCTEHGNCQTCSSHTDCSQCINGYYGDTCSESCSSGCNRRSCDRHTGDCSHGCKPSFYGDKCCLENGYCSKCSNNKECAECMDYWYGNLCNKSCPQNCNRNKCDRNNGICSLGCKDGYSGDRCCSPGQCETCSSDTVCAVCKAGHYGSNCELRCSTRCKPKECHKENGTCINGCQNGFTGDKCCLQGGHCDICSSNLNCRQCSPGYYGHPCSSKCSDGCEGKVCDRSTGECSNGCLDGRTGDKCCTEHGHCQTCSSHTDCSQCINGYYGNTCSESCSSGCKHGSCDRHTGDCSHGCKPDFYGDKCCLKNGRCSKCSNNKECAECSNYYYGNLCNKSCPQNCKRNKCDRNNGICSLGCKYRYSGDRCCSPGQCETCSSDTVCAVCKAGYYGSNCKLRCSARCKTKECHKENGTCINGCQNGFTGDKCCLQGGHCDRCSTNFNCGQCDPGYYGDDCNSRCSDGCKGKVCDRSTGACSNGCLADITGDKCCQKDGFCKTCNTNNECSICSDGYFGQNCDQRCSIGCAYSACKRLNGGCPYKRCKHGYSGDKCCVKNNNCKVCSTTSDCSECERGFYGKDCEYRCPANCMNDKCNKTDGVCSEGCKKGHHGEKCDKSCPGNCGDEKCRQNDGTCYNCIDGFYGDDCTKTCSPYCSSYNCRQDDGACAPCKDGYHGPTCRLKCYTNCISCSSHLNCGSRCKEGYHGSGCRSTCPRNCAACTSETRCTKCEPGYKGTACQDECSSCKPGTKCNQTSGYCYDACKDGYASRDCDIECGAKCVSCFRNHISLCTKCLSGRHGDWNWFGNKYYSYCSERCSKNCANGLCNERTGQCMTCPGSLHGPYCNCPEQCDKCHVDGSCTDCKETFANPSLECSCRKDMCIDTDGGCLSCLNATWYPDTDFSACCPCRNTCKDSRCDAEDFCTDGCELGYYGNGCKENCDDRQRRCVSCELGSGGKFSCKECKTGYYPKNDECVECSHNCVNGTCDPTSGRCKYSCKEGYWRERCDEMCGSNCISGTCDPSSGQCTHGCKDGYWDEKCDKECGQNCEKCSRKGKCLRCEAGRYQEDCFGRCSKGCKRTNRELRCNMNDGSCPLGCTSRNLHGQQCDLDCSNNCTDSECDWLSGKCSKGCQDNMFSDFCNQTCSDTCESIGDLSVCFDTNGTCIEGCVNGYYDDRCEESCHTNCINGTCERATGECVHGCVSGFAGADCSQALPSSAPGIISGVAGGGLAALVFLLVVLVRHRRKQRPEVGKVNDNVSLHSVENVPLDNTNHVAGGEDMPLDNTNHVAGGEDAVYANVRANAGIPTRTLVDYVKSMTEETYSEQYQKLPRGLTKPHDDALKPASVPRNRYKSIYPYDHCRVKLLDGDNDYINASYIDGYNRGREYIASLGPLKKTTEQFALLWQMIWQDKVERIVMVTNLDEPTLTRGIFYIANRRAPDKGMKCEKYWPDPDTSTEYGDVKVLCRNESTYVDYVFRSMQLTKAGDARTLHHFHYTAWPDKSAPADATSLIDFRNKVSNLPLQFNGPTVVHCSAGIGRTGTYIALDHLCMQADADQRVDVFECVLNMREQRLTMVQTLDQYIFLHRALAVYVTLGCQPIKSACFSEYVKTLNASRLKNIFKNLEVCRSLAEQETKAIDRNRTFVENNRKNADIPGDKFRVRLHLERTLGSSDYINAVFFNGYSQANRYIVAQTPVQGDEEDFVTLLLQERCTAIVDLDPVTSRDDSGLTYLLTNSPGSKVGKFKVTCRESASCTKFKQHEVTITVGNQRTVSPREMTIPLYQFQDWASDVKYPKSPEDFVEFIRGVEANARKSQENGPVLLNCGTAGGRSCLFYVVAMAMKNLETEHEISVVSTIHQARTRRPIAIPNKEQLAFCFHCLNVYLQTYETYSNFVM